MADAEHLLCSKTGTVGTWGGKWHLSTGTDQWTREKCCDLRFWVGSPWGPGTHRQECKLPVTWALGEPSPFNIRHRATKLTTDNKGDPLLFYLLFYPGHESGLPLWLSWLKVHLQCGRLGFNPWVGEIPWRRERLPTLVFWPGELHRVYSPWGRKALDTTERLYFSLIRVGTRSQTWGLSSPSSFWLKGLGPWQPLTHGQPSVNQPPAHRKTSSTQHPLETTQIDRR